MTKQQVSIAILTMVALGSLVGCGALGATEPTPVDEVPPVVAAAEGTVLAEAVIEPARWSELTFDVAGDVAGVLVQEEDSAQAGDALVQLDTADLQRAISQAELSLRQAEVNVRQAELSVRQAELNVRQAELRLEQLLEPADEADIAAAETTLSNANLAYQEARMNQSIVEHALSVGQDVEAARYAKDQAYRLYQDLVERKGREDTVTEGARIAYLEALGKYNRLVENADLDRTTARNGVTRAYLTIQDAQNALDELLEGPSEKDIEAAEKDIEAAQHDVETAKGNTEAAQTDIASAQLALETAISDLEEAVLIAPFDGVVTAVEVDPGDAVSPGQVMIVLATLDHLQARTIDLTELDVARVAMGQPVQVMVDGLPGVELLGHVSRVGLQSVDYRGDVTYPVTVELDEIAPGLRWGMTTLVEIDTD